MAAYPRAVGVTVERISDLLLSDLSRLLVGRTLMGGNT